MVLLLVSSSVCVRFLGWLLAWIMRLLLLGVVLGVVIVRLSVFVVVVWLGLGSISVMVVLGMCEVS